MPTRNSPLYTLLNLRQQYLDKADKYTQLASSLDEAIADLKKGTTGSSSTNLSKNDSSTNKTSVVIENTISTRTEAAKAIISRPISFRSKVYNYIQTEIDRCVRAADIAEGLLSHNLEGIPFADFTRKVTQSLAGLKKSGKVNNYSYGTHKRDTAWGRVDFFNQDGSVKEERQYSLNRQQQSLLD